MRRAVLSCLLAFSIAPGRAAAPAGEDIRAAVHRVWAFEKGRRQDDFEERIKSGDVYALYDMEVLTDNLLRYAEDSGDEAVLEDLTEIYSKAYPYLSITKDGHREWIFTSTVTPYARENPALLGGEVQLCSVQFLYLVSSLIDRIAHMRAGRRTPAMKDFCRAFFPVAAQDHYLRWLADMAPRLRSKLSLKDRVRYKNAVDDKEMWALAGMVKLLAAHRADAQVAALTPEEEKAFMDYAALGTVLLKSRLTKSDLKDFKGRPVLGLNFDLGLWDDYGDYAYSGYTGEKYPEPSDRKAAVNVGWDIGHASRFVDVFDTLYDNRRVTRQGFPDRATMKGLANQVAYGAFNKDFARPLFSNFMDGTNGWYRVGYSGRKDFGVPPYGLSSAVPEGGYGFWTKFNPDIRTVLAAFWRWAQKSKAGRDPEFLKYYGKDYLKDDGSPPLLEFLPSFAS